MGEDELRSRTVTWHDPAIPVAMAREMSGMEYLQGVLRGEVPPPPMASVLGIRLDEAEEGRVVFSAEPREEHYNPIGTVHAGLIATLADSALACSIYSLLPRGVGFTTVELHFNFVKAVTLATGRIHCEAHAVHVGGRLGTAEAKVCDADDRLHAHGSTTCFIFR